MMQKGPCRGGIRAVAAGLLIVAGIAFQLASPAIAADKVSHTDVARFLAGMPPSSGSPLARLAKSPQWRVHARALNLLWKNAEARQLSKIRLWSKQHIKTPNKSMLYMFGGPDFLYANTFFPNASTYVLAGLEPVGGEPNFLALSAARRNRGLYVLRSSLTHILRISYFITKDMNRKLQGQGFRGTLPVMYLFLARTGKTIKSYEYLQLNKDGTVTTLAKEKRGRPSGVRIVFSDKGSSEEKSLYYFSIDLSNGALQKTGFMAFMDKLGPADSFFKSASYLPHYASFSVIRNFIFKRSRRVVHDDTGPRLAHYDRKIWNVAPFGRYVRPIRIFSARYQPDMARYFVKMKAPKLTFGLGYQVRPYRTSIILATKKTVKAEAMKKDKKTKSE